ncbi:MAG TPA: mechanosensitive ion channel domain-containing protein [Candidatus Limnocylindria bacterium]|nr:mechanosensitive ion channel domain-containing protein [Candidatus Limnocylindria bacterium]
MDFGHTATQVMERASTHVPAVVIATVLVLAGWALGRLLGAWTRRLVGRVDHLSPGRALHNGLRRIGVERAPSDVVGGIVFWLVLLFFLTAATETLGLPVLATWLTGVTYYLPRVLVALLIVAIGLFVGTLAHDAVLAATTASGLAYGRLLARLAQVAVVMIAVVTGIDQAGVESRFLIVTITIVLGAVIGGAALAFGLGARTAVSNIIGSHYLRQTYRVGQTIRIGAVEGTIVAMTTTAVILDTSAGRVLVPGKEFSETASTLVSFEA